MICEVPLTVDSIITQGKHLYKLISKVVSPHFVPGRGKRFDNDNYRVMPFRGLEPYCQDIDVCCKYIHLFCHNL